MRNVDNFNRESNIHHAGYPNYINMVIEWINVKIVVVKKKRLLKWSL